MYTRYRRLVISVFVLFLCTKAFASVCAQPSIYIELKDSVHFDGDVVKLGDLAEVDVFDASDEFLDIEELVICSPPQPGNVRTINSRYVQTKLYQAGLKQGSFELGGADIVRIYVSHTVLSVDAFREALEQAVYERLSEQGISSEDVLIDVASTLFEISLPEGDVKFSFDMPSTFRSGSYNAIKSSVFVDGKLYLSRTVMVRVGIFQDVLVAKRRIAMHETLVEDDFSLDRLEVTGAMTSPLVYEILPGKMRASKTILQGKVLTQDLVEPIPDAFANDVVAIRVTVGNVYIETIGVLVSDSRIGERVAVRNMDSNTIVSGILVQRDVVVIEG